MLYLFGENVVNSIWNNAVDIGLNGSKLIRGKLAIDEEKYRSNVLFSDKPYKDLFLYAVLDEIQKAAISLLKWNEFFSGGNPKEMNEIQSQIYRLTLQSTFEEQSLRNRKLIELIVDILLFLKTNESIYYKDYIYLHQLIEIEFEKSDIKEFYNINNESYCGVIEKFKKEIQKLESNGLELDKRWYLKEKKNITEQKKVKLSSFKQKYIKLACNNNSDMVAVLGFSYNQVYSDSKYLHYNPHNALSKYNENEWISNGNRTAFLIINAIQSLEKLVNFKVITNLNKEYAEIVKKNNSEIFKETVLKRIEINDYVLANNDLGKVIDISTSKYNLKAYKVKMIDGISFDTYIENWFMPQRLQVIGNKNSIIEKIISIYKKFDNKIIVDKENEIVKMDDKEFEILLFETYREILSDCDMKNKI